MSFLNQTMQGLYQKLEASRRQKKPTQSNDKTSQAGTNNFSLLKVLTCSEAAH